MKTSTAASYGSCTRLNNLSIPYRVNAFKETAIDLLNQGRTIQQMTEVIECFIEDEQYEAAKGIMQAIETIKSK